MPSRTDTTGHTKAFIYPVMDHWVESQSAPASGVPRGGGQGGSMAPGRKPWRGRRASL